MEATAGGGDPSAAIAISTKKYDEQIGALNEIEVEH